MKATKAASRDHKKGGNDDEAAAPPPKLTVAELLAQAKQRHEDAARDAVVAGLYARGCIAYKEQRYADALSLFWCVSAKGHAEAQLPSP